jgi:nitric oxide reductase subunit C
MPVRYRKLMLGILACAFSLQTALIYADQAGPDVGPLSATALAGRGVWQKNNCQTCHQIYGFGGHLGPDLTNIVASLGIDTFAAFLKAGPAQMPTYALSQDEVSGLYTYLSEVSRTGTSVPHAATLELKEVPWFTFDH